MYGYIRRVRTKLHQINRVVYDAEEISVIDFDENGNLIFE